MFRINSLYSNLNQFKAAFIPANLLKQVSEVKQKLRRERGLVVRNRDLELIATLATELSQLETEVNIIKFESFKANTETRRRLFRGETFLADHSAAAIKWLFPTRFAREVATTKESGSIPIGASKRSAWFSAIWNYLSGQHVERLGTEEEWTLAYALGFADYDKKAPFRKGSAFILSRVGKYGLILEGGEGTVSAWRSEKNRHGTGVSMDPEVVMRLAGGAREGGLCEVRKLATVSRNRATNEREVNRIRALGQNPGGRVGNLAGAVRAGGLMLDF